MILLLRFRDLSPPTPGTTIERHQEVVDQHEYVWWAWWKKQTEEVPIELWVRLNRAMDDDNPAEIFLVDSGQRLLYRTTLAEIRFDNRGGLLAAPEGGEKTPEYYRDEPFASWFKLGPIEQVENPDEVLEALAYERIPHDDLVVVDEALFVDARIRGVNQLLEFGNVTYWVARNAGPGAEFAQSPRRRVSPSAVAPGTVIQAVYSRILHVSDLHVSEGTHAFALEDAGEDQPTLAASLHRTLQEGRLPGLVLVTGDLTWTGSTAEFDAVYKVLDDLRAALGLRPEDFVIIPGNHDIQWNTDQPDAQLYAHDGIVALAGAQAKANYAAFFERWYGRPANAHLSIGRRFFLNGGPTLDVVGFNSNELQQVQGAFAGIGRVTDTAMDETANEMRWSHGRATQVRAILTHHHVLPVISRLNPGDAGRGFGVAIDAEAQLVRAAAWGVDLILHGHQHQPYIGAVQREQITGDPIHADRPTLVVGAGSVGVVGEHLGPIRQKSFNLIEMSSEGLELTLFGTPNDSSRFEEVARAFVAWKSGVWKHTRPA